ncbi:MAG TPA: hypothetical protein PJ994_09685, partial [Tepidiformaceae bacterium]|nr:hypothetical protein [Tepidiformaceae bacterium]
VPIAPTRHPSGRAGGLDEGAGTLNPDAPKPSIFEYLIAGGNRFSFPLPAHAGVEDYFGTERNGGKVHVGVDFSFVGVKDILVKLSDDGKLLRYIGTAGKAAQVKALVNMVMNINTAGLAEGL